MPSPADRIKKLATRPAACLLGVVVMVLAASAPAVEVTDSCNACHPPLAMSPAHPAADQVSLAACSQCHASDTPLGLVLWRAMHLGHIEDMGFDCTLCHVADDSELETLQSELSQRLAP